MFFTNYDKHVVSRKSLRFDNFLLIIEMFIFVVNLFRTFIVGGHYFSAVVCTFSIYVNI